MTELAKYEAAERALADAAAVDEVLEIRSQAAAWIAYAKQAKNRDLEIKAARIRFRAERRLGEMLLASDLSKGGRPKEKTCSDQERVFEVPPTLAEAGIDRKLSSKAQRVAAMDAAEFEHALARHAEEMRTGQGRVAMDLLKIDAEEKGRAHRRNLAQALSTQSIELPTGRRYPANYIDCPWERKGGIGDRAYENHYPTMNWPEILAFLRKARDTLLPDAWSFFWIPRAHLLALVEVETEVTVAETGEVVIANVMMPLAWACAQALGMDSYSTCFVWTKTDEDFPDDSGSGLIAWDQDELLLLFKRGRGLPKPAGSEKFGSNHRERPREHSRKPDFYRHMIATMVGCDSAGQPLPVLEMFARVDAEHPLPPGWSACGNQAGERPRDDVVPDRAARLFGEQVAAKSARQVWPAGHVVTMTNPVVDGAMRSIGTCACGEVFSFAWGEYEPMDAAIEAHWQAFDDQPEKTDGRGNAIEDTSFAVVPSAGETVTAAADATQNGASLAAAVAEISEPAFPPTEFADLQLFLARAPAEQLAPIGPTYARRGLVQEWLGEWRITRAGEVRLEVLERERADRAALFQKHLSDEDFAQWRAIAAIAGGEAVDREIARHLIGGSYAECGADDRLALTASGHLWLVTVEGHVEKREGIVIALAPLTAIAPKQLDLVDMLQGGQ